MNIILGVSGSIAACKVPEIISLLIELGHDVKVVLTKQATSFVTPLTCQALSTNPVFTDFESAESDNQMDHINLANWADILIVAPASANMIAKLALGLADDLLSTLYLATQAKVFLAPAMNTNMWHQHSVQTNITQLQDNNVTILGPITGLLACKTRGLGKMMEPKEIVSNLNILNKQAKLHGKNILITLGRTIESIDPVRYISNHSSGKMGTALVSALINHGANVTCIAGKTDVQPVPGAKYISAESAELMLSKTLNNLANQDWFIGCAAVADYQPIKPKINKIKKTSTNLNLELTPTPDILAAVSKHKLRPNLVIGFAAESQDLINNAKQKLKTKNCDLILANLIGPQKGLNCDDNQVTIISKQFIKTLDLMPKTKLAYSIISAILDTINCKNTTKAV